jgi:simple sugar transport system substrate-binding protein
MLEQAISTMARHGFATKRQALIGLASMALLAPSAARRAAFAQINRARVAVIVKVPVSRWFDLMEIGIKAAEKDYDIDARMIRPATLDPRDQMAAADEMIKLKPNVLAIVPIDAAALGPIVAIAQAAGIQVITHESPSRVGNEWDIELTSVNEFSERTIDALAFNMGEVGEYMIIVGSPTVPLHNAWADRCVFVQKAKYPKMEVLSDRFGVGENAFDSYKAVLDQIRAHPNLKGILAFGSQGPIGAARALDERGKGKQIALVGTFLPSDGVQYVKSGIIRAGFLWSPILAGRAIIALSEKLIRGENPIELTDISQVGPVRVYPEQHLIQASRIEVVNRRTIDQLIAAGL